MAKYNKLELIQALKQHFNEYGVAPNSRTFHIHQNVYRYHFGNWNKALTEANIPLNDSLVEMSCPECKKSFKYIKSLKRIFCSKSCSAKYHNKRRPKKPKKKYKRPMSEYQQWKLTISGPFCKIHNRTCKHCSGKFISPKKYSYCKDHIDLYSTPNRDRYRFQFNVFHYPDLFNTTIIEQVGFYDGKPESQHKITRDHKLSVTEAIKQGYSPYYITHPINCELMTWSDNYLKRTKCSISYEELVSQVDEYELQKFQAGFEPAASPIPRECSAK